MATSQGNATMPLLFTNWFELAPSLVCLAYTPFFSVLSEISSILACLLPDKLVCCTSIRTGPQEMHMEDWFHAVEKGSCMFTK